MSVYYKFNSELNYSYVDFDGLHISVSDLKKAILHQKRLGKSADFDLLVNIFLVSSTNNFFFTFHIFTSSVLSHYRFRMLKQKKNTKMSMV